MRLRWTAPAAQHLYSITHYIRRDNPAAARDVAKTIYDGCESPVNSPHRGRKGKQAGTRELVFSPLPYIAAYRVAEDIAEILHIWHGARDRR
jgi:plasmid stabilization system protein ParE